MPVKGGYGQSFCHKSGMKIHFLTTGISNASGGAIYDNEFYQQVIKKYPETRLFDDTYFLDRADKPRRSAGFIAFNRIYKKHINDLFDCDYLIMNSRIYTRFIMLRIDKILLKYPNTKYIVIHHHNNYMVHRGGLHYIHKYFEMRVLKTAAQLIVPNQYVIDQLQKKAGLDNIVCLPSSFEKKEFRISGLNNKSILFVGNIEKRKGLLYGLKAFQYFYQRNKNYTFRIAGKFDEDDAYYKKLKQFVAKNDLGTAVVFEGRVTDERLDWLYSNSDLFLFPSLLEGYGWVMVEAMGHGLPVIAFDNSAMPYTVKNNYNGILIENCKWEKMGQALEDALDDKGVLKRMQQGALKTYQKVPSKEMLKAQMKLYIDSWK